MVVRFQGEDVACAPLELLVDGCPVEDYSSLTEDVLRAGKCRESDLSGIAGVAATADDVRTPAWPDLLDTFLTTSHYAAVRDIYEQFDYEINQRTLSGPGDDHTLLYEPESGRAVALTVHSRSPWTLLHAYRGTRAVLAAAFRRCVAAGALPGGVSNCLNFPSPDRMETMVDFGGTTLAMREFCEAMQVPVTGGNVSFYNESDVGAIAPTPVFVLVGESQLPIQRYRYQGACGTLYTLGQLDAAAGDVYQMWQLRQTGSLRGCRVPEIDFAAERALGEVLLPWLVEHGEHVWLRDIGKGGTFRRIVERFARADRDVVIAEERTDGDHLFGEGPCSYLLFVPDDYSDDCLTPLQSCGLRSLGRVEAGTGTLRGGAGFETDLMQVVETWSASLSPYWAE